MISSLLLSCLLAASAPLLVSTEGLQGLVNMCIVDGRNSADFAAGHSPGAVHLDADTLSEIRDGIHGLLKPLDQLHQIGDPEIIPLQELDDRKGNALRRRQLAGCLHRVVAFGVDKVDQECLDSRICGRLCYKKGSYWRTRLLRCAFRPR